MSEFVFLHTTSFKSTAIPVLDVMEPESYIAVALAVIPPRLIPTSLVAVIEPIDLIPVFASIPPGMDIPIPFLTVSLPPRFIPYIFEP